MKAVLRLLAILAVFTMRAQATTLEFTRGNERFAAGDFSGAVTQYETAVRAGNRSTALFYNLGNAAYRAGDFGRAILAYERALALEPHHPEAEANLRVAREQARALELRPSAFERWSARATPSALALAGSIGFWCAAFALASAFCAARRSLARGALIVASVLLCLTACAAIYFSETGKAGRALAIVTGAEIEARVATADSARSVLALPPGSEITILSRRGDWLYAGLPNDLRGWIPASAAELVRL